MLALVLRTLVDRISRLPRDTTVPEAMRLYRENIALKAQLDALERRLFLMEGKPKRVPLGLRAAQVFASLRSAHAGWSGASTRMACSTATRWPSATTGLRPPRRTSHRSYRRSWSRRGRARDSCVRCAFGSCRLLGEMFGEYLQREVVGGGTGSGVVDLRPPHPDRGFLGSAWVRSANGVAFLGRARGCHVTQGPAC